MKWVKIVLIVHLWLIAFFKNYYLQYEFCNILAGNMGKKQKSRNSRSSSSQLLNDTSKNSSFCSSSGENSQYERILPENFIISSVETTGCDLCMYNYSVFFPFLFYRFAAFYKKVVFGELCLIKHFL